MNRGLASFCYLRKVCKPVQYSCLITSILVVLVRFFSFGRKCYSYQTELPSTVALICILSVKYNNYNVWCCLACSISRSKKICMHISIHAKVHLWQSFVNNQRCRNLQCKTLRFHEDWVTINSCNRIEP